MPATVDHAVFTWDVARPKLREDLLFHFQMVERKPTYVVEDRTNRSYHQIGVPEFRFLRSLNGSKSAAKLLVENSIGRNALSESEIESLLRWAIDNHLLQPSESDQADRRLAHADEQAPRRKSKGMMRLFFLKVPLGSPDRFIRPFTRLLGWTLSPWALLMAMVIFVYGIYLAATSLPPFLQASSQAFLPQNWIWLIATTITLKFIHELWHGIACQKYGGTIPEWGVQLIVWITPLTYVDATSSWGFPSRRQRITVAAAGMYVELLIAVGALHLWSVSEPGMLKEMAFNVLVSASIVTLLFNANPLMRFDGYYILSDLLDLRNLSQRGQQAFAWLNRRVFLGTRNQVIPPTLRKRFLIICTYGAAAWLWRIVITVALLALAANLFHGMGLIPLTISLLLFLASLLHSLITFFSPSELSGKIPWKSATWRIGLAVLLIAAALFWIPVNPSARGLAVVEYQDKAILRAETPGFMAEVHCADGGLVTEGQLLVSLANEEESTQLQSLESQLALSETKARILYLHGDLNEWQAEREKLEGLKERVGVQRKRVAALEIRATISGRLNAPELVRQEGTYFETGKPIVTLIPDRPPEFLISLRQQDFQRIATDLADSPKPFRIRLTGRPGEYSANVRRFESKATLAIPSPVLASSAGGPLPVRNIDQRESASVPEGLARGSRRSESVTYFDSIRPEARRDNLELLLPRFNLIASASSGTGLKEGEWGFSFYEGETTESLGSWLWQSVSGYLEKQFRS